MFLNHYFVQINLVKSCQRVCRNSWKESCLRLGMLSNGFTGRSRRSFSTILSSISDDLWLCAEEGFVYPPDGPGGQRLIWTEAPRGSTRPINCLVCLARTHCFNGLFMSLLRFSCNKSISMFFPTPPFQFAVEAHLQRRASAPDEITSFWITLINISMA